MIKRYCVKEIEQIFSDENKYNNWLKIELLVLEFYKNKKIISETQYDNIVKNIHLDLYKIYEYETIVKHDVIAFVDYISSLVDDDSKKWIHYGLTSTDVVDTANAIALKQANDIILNEIDELLKTLKKLAIKHKYTYQMGRTHGIHAEITTFGLKTCLWYDELLRNKERFINARNDIETGKISGAVGTFANTGTQLQEFVCKKLKINSASISTQVLSRDNHAYYFSVLNIIGLTINKIASELRHLSRTEIFEVNEMFSKGQKGSSAMPHKKNPITLENICGLSRLLRGYSLTINENVDLWDERDISHSSNERVIFLDAISILVNILKKINYVLNNLNVNKDKMLENIKINRNIIFSQTLLLNLIKKNNLSRTENYNIVQQLAFEAFENKLDFKDVILNSKKIEMYLDKKEIEEIFDYDYHLKYIDEIYDRVFKK